MSSVRERLQSLSQNPFNDIIHRRNTVRQALAERAATVEQRQQRAFGEWDECCRSLLKAVAECLLASSTQKSKLSWLKKALFGTAPFRIIGDNKACSWKLLMQDGKHRIFRRDVRGRRLQDPNAEVRLVFDIAGDAIQFQVEYLHGLTETSELSSQGLQALLRQLLIEGRLGANHVG